MPHDPRNDANRGALSFSRPHKNSPLLWGLWWTRSVLTSSRRSDTASRSSSDRSAQGVERHRRRGVAEHPLHRLHVRARAGREARGGMPQVVDRDPREGRVDRLSLGDGAQEPAVAGMRPLEVRVASTEDELVASFAGDLVREALQQEAGERHAPRLVRLRRPDDDSGRDLHGVLLNAGATTLEVQVADPAGRSNRPVKASITAPTKPTNVWGLLRAYEAAVIEQWSKTTDQSHLLQSHAKS